MNLQKAMALFDHISRNMDSPCSIEIHSIVGGDYVFEYKMHGQRIALIRDTSLVYWTLDSTPDHLDLTCSEFASDTNAALGIIHRQCGKLGMKAI